MPSLLYPNKYVETGTFIKHSGSSSTETKEFMLPLVIGRGSKYLKQSETLRRGYVYQEQVSVSELYPNIFHTKYPFFKDKKLIQLWIDNQKISKEEWDIVDEQTIQLKQFTPNVSYFVDYQSSSTEVKDRFDLDVVLFESVSDQVSEEYYHSGNADGETVCTEIVYVLGTVGEGPLNNLGYARYDGAEGTNRYYCGEAYPSP